MLGFSNLCQYWVKKAENKRRIPLPMPVFCLITTGFVLIDKLEVSVSRRVINTSYSWSLLIEV